MLVKICVCGVNVTLNLKSKITFANNDLSIEDFLKTTKQYNGSYLSFENSQEVPVSSGFL